MLKLCRRCMEEKPIEGFRHNRRNKDGLQDWCKACMNAYNSALPTNTQKLRRATASYAKRNPLKIRARNAFHTALYYGRITKKPCEVCGDAKSQGHHEDYTKPLDVRWLCLKHHREEHAKT